MRILVFDASPLVTLFRGKPGSDSVERLLTRMSLRSEPGFISSVNWGEIYYSICKIHGRANAAQRLAELSRIFIPVAAEPEDALQAADLKNRYGLPYADGFAAALAIRKKCPLVVADRDFETVKSMVTLLRII